MADSIFTKIIKGEIPCHKIYEDDSVMAFLDIHPVKPGHTLVVPKKQIEQFTELDPEDYSYLMAITQIIAQQIQKALGVKRICMRIEGLDVSHTHVHLIPTEDEEGIYDQDMNAEPNHEALAKMAKRLTF